MSVKVDIFDNLGMEIEPDQLYSPGRVPMYPEQVNLLGKGSRPFGTAGYVLGFQPTLSLLDGWARLTVTGPGKLQATVEVLAATGPPPECDFLIPLLDWQPSDLYKGQPKSSGRPPS